MLIFNQRWKYLPTKTFTNKVTKCFLDLESQIIIFSFYWELNHLTDRPTETSRNLLFCMFLTYFKIYIVQNSSGGSRKRLKNDDKKRYDFNDAVTIVFTDSHLPIVQYFLKYLGLATTKRSYWKYQKIHLGKWKM